MDNERLIDLRESDLRAIVASEVAKVLRATTRGSGSQIVSGRKKIAEALGIGTDKLDQMVADGYLRGAVKKNGRTMICDINKAFEAFNDEWNN